jgi:hypothetical protein
MADVDPVFMERLSRLGPALLNALEAFEIVRRRLHPPAIPSLREALLPISQRLDGTLSEFRSVAAPDGLGDLATQLITAARPRRARCTTSARPACRRKPYRAYCTRCASTAAPGAPLSMRKVLPPVSLYFVEAPYRERIAEIDPEPSGEHQVGILTARDSSAPAAAFLCVPERYDRRAPGRWSSHCTAAAATAMTFCGRGSARRAAAASCCCRRRRRDQRGR